MEKDLREEKEKNSGWEKALKDVREEKGEDLRGGKGLRGERGGKDLNKERVEKILGRKREKISGGERP